MTASPRLALFSSGLFFGGGLDHLILIVRDSPVSHYGLQLSPLGQAGFAIFDFSIAWLLYLLHGRWSRTSAVG